MSNFFGIQTVKVLPGDQNANGVVFNNIDFENQEAPRTGITEIVAGGRVVVQTTSKEPIYFYLVDTFHTPMKPIYSKKVSEDEEWTFDAVPENRTYQLRALVRGSEKGEFLFQVRRSW